MTISTLIKKYYYHLLLLLILSFAIVMPPEISYSQDVHADEEVHDEEEAHDDEEIEISLTQEQISAAGITTVKLQLDKVTESITATGEVRANDYASSIVTPRIPSIIIERHARLGDRVDVNQPLITLFSVEMASAQAKFINVSREWQRVQNLGSDIVSAKRYLQAETDYLQLLAELKSYGMSAEDINRLYETVELNKPGEYVLYSSQVATVASDDFLVGALVEPGTVLFKLINEDTVWIESAVSLGQFDQAFAASRAVIGVDDYMAEARVLIADEIVDEETRRRKIRLVVENEDHNLHPGQFVNVEFLIPGEEEGYSVPKEAVLRAEDGDWQLFIQDDDGGFLPREVEIIKSTGDRYVVSDVNEGETVVVTGAFFIQSELAKSGFSVHNH